MTCAEPADLNPVKHLFARNERLRISKPRINGFALSHDVGIIQTRRSNRNQSLIQL